MSVAIPINRGAGKPGCCRTFACAVVAFSYAHAGVVVPERKPSDAKPAGILIGETRFALPASVERMQWPVGSSSIMAGLANGAHVALINTHTGQMTRELEIDARLWDVPPGGRIAAAVTRGIEGGGWRLIVFDLASRRVRWSQDRIIPPAAIRFSPNGERLLVYEGGSDFRGTSPRIIVIAAQTGAMLSQTTIANQGPGDFPDDIALTDQGLAFVAADFESSPILVLDTASGDDVTERYVHSEPGIALGANRIFLSRDGRFVATIFEHGYSIHELADHMRQRVVVAGDSSFDGNGFYFQHAAFSDAGDQVAIAASSGLEIVELPSGQRRAQFARSAEMSCFSPDGTRIAFARDGQISIARIDEAHIGAAGRIVDASDRFFGLATDPRSDAVAATDGRRVVVWDSRSGEEIARIENPNPKTCLRAIAFHPDGRHLVASDAQQIWLLDRGDTSAKPVEWLSWEKAPNVLHALSIEFSDDGKTGIVIRNDRADLFVLADPPTAKPKRIRKLDLVYTRDWLTKTRLARDGRSLAWAPTGEVLIYDLDPEELRDEFRTKPGAPVAFSSDLKYCASIAASDKDQITITNIETLRPHAVLPVQGPTEGPFHPEPSLFAFSTDNHFLAVAMMRPDSSWSGIGVWNLESQEFLGIVEPHRGRLRTIEFCGRDRVIILNFDHTIQILEIGDFGIK